MHFIFHIFNQASFIPPIGYSVWPDASIETRKWPNFTQKWPNLFFSLKVTLFIIAQKVGKYLGYFCKKICCQDRSKVAQSGHTAAIASTTSATFACFGLRDEMGEWSKGPFYPVNVLLSSDSTKQNTLVSLFTSSWSKRTFYSSPAVYKWIICTTFYSVNVLLGSNSTQQNALVMLFTSWLNANLSSRHCSLGKSRFDKAKHL